MRDNKDRVFMSYKGRRIWYRMVNLDVKYMVAKGNGTDEVFLSWEDAINWIDEHPRKKKEG